MKQQYKNRRTIHGHDIWISLSAGMVCLLLSVYSLIKQDQHTEGLLTVGMSVFFYIIICYLYLKQTSH